MYYDFEEFIFLFYSFAQIFFSQTTLDLNLNNRAYVTVPAEVLISDIDYNELLDLG